MRETSPNWYPSRPTERPERSRQSGSDASALASPANSLERNSSAAVLVAVAAAVAVERSPSVIAASRLDGGAGPAGAGSHPRARRIVPRSRRRPARARLGPRCGGDRHIDVARAGRVDPEIDLALVAT